MKKKILSQIKSTGLPEFGDGLSSLTALSAARDQSGDVLPKLASQVDPVEKDTIRGELRSAGNHRGRPPKRAANPVLAAAMTSEASLCKPRSLFYRPIPFRLTIAEQQLRFATPSRFRTHPNLPTPEIQGDYILAGISFWTLRARRREAFRATMHPPAPVAVGLLAAVAAKAHLPIITPIPVSI